MKRLVLLFFLAITLVACYEPLEMPDWSKSVAKADSLHFIKVGFNSAFGNSVVTRGTVNAKIGSYELTNVSSEAIKLSAFAITMNENASSFQNLLARVGAVQIGQTYFRLSQVERYTFSPSYGSFIIPAHLNIAVDFYCDVSSTNPVTGIITPPSATSWVSCSGIGITTGDTIVSIGIHDGQIITIR